LWSARVEAPMPLFFRGHAPPVPTLSSLPKCMCWLAHDLLPTWGDPPPHDRPQPQVLNAFYGSIACGRIALYANAQRRRIAVSAELISHAVDPYALYGVAGRSFDKEWIDVEKSRMRVGNYVLTDLVVLREI
jgi:hypothetical protein